MKTNSLALDPEMTALLGECAPGESKEMMVTVTVDAKDDTGLQATVTGVEPYEKEEEEVEEEPAPMPKKPAGSKSKAMMEALA